MRRWISAAAVATALSFTPAWLAAQNKPANATAECKDGTYSTAKSKKGACSGHGGIKTWLAGDEGDNAKKETKAAAKDTKDAAKDTAKDTGKAAKDAGNATKDSAKSAAKATGSAADAGANQAKGTAGTAAAAAQSSAKTVTKPSDAPQDATAKCKDGTFSHAKQHRGACSNHGGVAEWYK